MTGQIGEEIPQNVPADTDWDNTMIRLNFDQTDIGSMVNLKDNVPPSSEY